MFRQFSPRGMSRARLVWLALILGVLVPLVPRDAAAGYVRASTRNPFFRRSDSTDDSAWFTVVANALAATIKWTSGPNVVGATTYPVTPFGPEPKFNAGPTARIWTGYSKYDPGNGNPPYAFTSGEGKSGVGVLTYYADWTVRAGGDDNNGATNYYARSEGKDPWPILSGPTFTGLPTSTYDLYVPLGIMEGQSAGGSGPAQGSLDYDVSYETAAGVLHALHVTVTGTQVVATSPDSPPGMTLYQMSNPDAPTSQNGDAITLSQLGSMVSSHIDGTNTFTSPVYVGVMLHGLPIPTQTLSDGSVAHVSVDTDAFESHDVGPTPAPHASWGQVKSRYH